jgi:hypothetical protein
MGTCVSNVTRRRNIFQVHGKFTVFLLSFSFHTNRKKISQLLSQYVCTIYVHVSNTHFRAVFSTLFPTSHARLYCRTSEIVWRAVERARAGVGSGRIKPNGRLRRETRLERILSFCGGKRGHLSHPICYRAIVYYYSLPITRSLVFSLQPLKEMPNISYKKTRGTNRKCKFETTVLPNGCKI